MRGLQRFRAEPAVAADGAGIMGFYRVTGNCWALNQLMLNFFKEHKTSNYHLYCSVIGKRALPEKLNKHLCSSAYPLQDFPRILKLPKET